MAAVTLYTIVWLAAVGFIVGCGIFAWGRRAGRREEERAWRFAAATDLHEIRRADKIWVVMERHFFWRNYHHPLLRAERMLAPNDRRHS